ncbi:MAG: macro domain-containing protein [Vulcanimicrobiota bacterium]
MFTVLQGNLFESGAEALVNTVNCVGVMGKGVALQVKQSFPDVFRVYQQDCKKGLVQLGKVHIVARNALSSPQFVINFPTKDHWKGRSRYSDIEAGLVSLRQEIQALKIKSVAVPPLGCGLGGLDWEKVLPMIQKHLGNLQGVNVLVYAPAGAPQATALKVGSLKPKMTPGRAAILLLMDIYKSLDYRLAMIEVQKLAYFLQTAGEPLKLTFTAGRYGPYADALNHVLQKMEGHYITGTGDGSRGPEVEVNAIPEALAAARSFLQDAPSTQSRAERVAKLIEGFQTPFGMELLGTVHWVCHTQGAHSVAEAVSHVQSWNDRKRSLFSPRHIEVAYERLQTDEWLPV